MKRIFWFLSSLVAVVVTTQLAWAVLLTWNPAFEITPAGGDPISQGDDRIRDLKDNIRERLETEIEFGTQIGPDTGRMREGSARAYFQAAAPAAIPQPDIAGASALGATDEGRVWRDSDAGAETLNVWNGAAWVDAVREWTLGVTFNSTVNLDPGGLVLQKAGANALDPHEHGARHRDLTTAAGAGEDYMQFSIQQVLQNSGSAIALANTVAINCATATTIATLAYDTSGRRGAGSPNRSLIIATGHINDDGGGMRVELGLCDGAANLDASTAHQRIIRESGGIDGHYNFAIVYFWANASTAAHTVTLRGTDVTDDSPASGTLILVDLGVDNP